MNINIKEENVELGFANPAIDNSPSIFIGKVSIDQEMIAKLGGESARELYLFGAKVKTGEITRNGIEAFVLKYAVIEIDTKTGKKTEHILAQHNSVMYHRDGDGGKEESADMIKKKDILYLVRPPKWKVSEASIPTYNDQLFYFAAQFYLPENDTAKQYIVWSESLYLFVQIRNHDELIVQIHTQDTSAQSAEEHYKLEEMISEFERHYHNSSIVEQLAKKGDKWFYEYALESKKTDQTILNILHRYAKTKAMKTEIAKRLKNAK